jgi:uncharacterized damage-inducible protein DinB
MNANELFAHWDVVRRGLFHALDRLTDEQLGFVPREGLWSLGTVARHIAGAEEGWFRYVVVRERGGWPDYTAEDYPTVASIKGLLADVRARTVAYLETVDVSDVDRVVKTPWGKALHPPGHLARAGARDPPPGRDLPDAGIAGYGSSGSVAMWRNDDEECKL